MQSGDEQGRRATATAMMLSGELGPELGACRGFLDHGQWKEGPEVVGLKQKHGRAVSWFKMLAAPFSTYLDVNPWSMDGCDSRLSGNGWIMEAWMATVLIQSMPSLVRLNPAQCQPRTRPVCAAPGSRAMMS